jgi:hypothetical protein
MDDPELFDDEHILLRSQDIFINSIPFEGILTNKRIILTDRTTILLPRKEIPLLSLRNTEAVEDAAGDPILRLALRTGAGKTGQVTLTFPSETPDTRTNERDVWEKLLKENTSPSGTGQDVHVVIPAYEPVSEKPDYSIQYRVEGMKTPALIGVTGAITTTVRKEVTWTTSTEWITESSPARNVPRVYDVIPSGSGTFSPPEKGWNNLIFGVIFLVFIIISSMLMSITATLYAQNSPQSISPQGISTTTQISSSAPRAVPVIPNPTNPGILASLIPSNVPPGNSAKALPSAPLVVQDPGRSSGTISPYVKVEPKATPELERHSFLQHSITEKYGDGYVSIYSLTDQNISQVLPYVSFSLHNPPLVIDYNVTPLSQLRLKHVEYKMVDTYYDEDIEVNRPYEDSWFKIIVRNKDTGEVVTEDGFGRTYSFQMPKQLVIREYGNYSFEFTGNYGVLDLDMKVKEEGNFL